MNFHHEGVVSEDLSQDMEIYQVLGFEKESEIFEDPVQKIRGVFLKKGDFRIELLEPLNDQSPLRSYLKRGVKIYHHAFETDSLDDRISHLQENGFLLVSPPAQSVFFESRIAFLYASNNSLIELIETSRSKTY